MVLRPSEDDDLENNDQQPPTNNAPPLPLSLSPPLSPEASLPPKLVIGILGGIGSGKSFVARTFAAEGQGVVLQADEMGHAALREPGIREQVVARWGTGVLDAEGNIDRRKLGKIVFAEPAELSALEALVFPSIDRQIEEAIAAAQARPEVRLIVLDAAIMLETGWDRVCDHRVFVDVPRAVQQARVQARNGWSEADLLARERHQWPLEEKRRRADAVIDNSAGPKTTTEQVKKWLIQWRSEAASG